MMPTKRSASLTKSFGRKYLCGAAVSAVKTGETPVPQLMILFAKPLSF